jgi:hypothetical protein
MHAGLVAVHQRSPLGVILVVSLLGVLAAGSMMAVGLTVLLGLENTGAVDLLPSLRRLF